MASTGSDPRFDGIPEIEQTIHQLCLSIPSLVGIIVGFREAGWGGALLGLLLYASAGVTLSAFFATRCYLRLLLGGPVTKRAAFWMPIAIAMETLIVIFIAHRLGIVSDEPSRAWSFPLVLVGGGTPARSCYCAGN
jgi:hypothetical protein